jgi:hypothetical protein
MLHNPLPADLARNVDLTRHTSARYIGWLLSVPTAYCTCNSQCMAINEDCMAINEDCMVTNEGG